MALRGGGQVALFVFGYLRGSYLAAIALGTCTWLLMTPGHEGEWQWWMWTLFVVGMMMVNGVGDLHEQPNI